MGRRTRYPVAVVAFALTLAGCGGGSPSPAPQSHGDVLRVIKAAESTTAEQKSMQVRGTLTMDLGAITGTSTGAVTENLSGVMQTKPLLGRLTIAGLAVAGHSLGNVTALMTPQAIYMSMPLLTRATGKQWAEIKFSEMKTRSGFDFSQLMSQAQQMQPSQYIAQLEASGDVRDVGTETVDGISTTHYAGTVSTAESLSNYSPALRQQLSQVMKRSGFTSSTIDAWLDSKGLVRRIRTSANGGTGKFTFSMDVLAYGVAVNVTPPPASQVADLAQVAKAGSVG